MIFRGDQEAANVVFDVAQTRELHVDLDGAAVMRVRVTCELPSPTVILAGAAVT